MDRDLLRPSSTRPLPPWRQSSAWFLAGPIPGEWLSVASTLPGKSLHVALAIWHLAGLTRSDVVRMSHAALRRFGVGRDAARVGLRRLESASLVFVNRQPGRSPVVSIRQAAVDEQSSES